MTAPITDADIQWGGTTDVPRVPLDTHHNGDTPEIDVTAVTDVTPNNDAVKAVTPPEPAPVTAVTPSAVGFRVFDVETEVNGRTSRPGVWWRGETRTKHGPAPLERWVSSPLHIDALTYDAAHNNVGRMLRFRDVRGQWRTWAMPMELLAGHGDELRGALLSMGLQIDPNAHQLLGQYLQAHIPDRHVRCAVQVGWSGTSYVLPDVVVGPDAADVIFQSGERSQDADACRGTLDGWRVEMAARAIGNPLLMFVMAASFVGPLLAKCQAEGGGVHLVGDSSTGKTTALEIAGATWGGPGTRRSWRATANGMEGAAALCNDGLLVLDEISECDPRDVGAIIYALGNGTGKQRATRTGAARSVIRWRCFLLSSGERTIATAMAEGGKLAKAGQSVRLLDVPAARRFGAWDTLHDCASGPAFSDTLKRAAAMHYGHAGRAFLRRLTGDERNFSELFERVKALPSFAADAREGQDKRAAARFALVGLAGELATEYGLTGWPEGAAVAAAAEMFETWRASRGRGNEERRQIPERVAEFIERHGDSRFSGVADTSPVRDRAGWWRDDATHGRIYLFTSAGLREALHGFDFGRALDTLQAVGALRHGSGERATRARVGSRTVLVYPVVVEALRGGA